MQEILEKLSKLQIEAANRGIDFSIDYSYHKDNPSSVRVNISYTSTGDISRGYAFTTTISEDLESSEQDNRLSETKYFITSIR